MTYRGIVSNGVVVLEGEKPAEGTIVDVTPRGVSSETTHVSVRLEELRTLKAGWFDGAGRPLSSTGLDWLTRAFGAWFPAELVRPYLYPTPEGNIQAEWSVKPWEISLEIDLVSHLGQWHSLNMKTDFEEARNLDLNSVESWKWLASEIASKSRGIA